MQSFDRVEPIDPAIAELLRPTIAERHPPVWIEESAPTSIAGYERQLWNAMTKRLAIPASMLGGDTNCSSHRGQQ